MAREFIDREHQFPVDTGLTPADQLNTQKAVDNMNAAPRGDPPKSYDVRSVYDSRPVQGFDFNIVDSIAKNESSNPMIVSFTVPQGYVCVLRKLHHFTDPPVSIVSRADVQVSLLVNGSAVKYNQNIPVGNESDDIVECFVIADEFSVVSASFNIDATIFSDVNFTMYGQFYGQFLLKTSVNYKFEVANPSAKQWIQPPLQIMPPSLPPASAPTVIQQPAPVAVNQPVPMMTVQPVPQAKPAIVHRSLVAAPRLSGIPIIDRRSGRIVGYK